MWVLKQSKTIILLFLLNCSDQQIDLSVEQISIMHRAEKGSVMITHFRTDSNFLNNALYEPDKQIIIRLNEAKWKELISELNSQNFMQWSGRENSWHNRPEEYEISLTINNKTIIKRLNNGVKEKFKKITILLNTYRN